MDQVDFSPCCPIIVYITWSRPSIVRVIFRVLVHMHTNILRIRSLACAQLDSSEYGPRTDSLLLDYVLMIKIACNAPTVSYTT